MVNLNAVAGWKLSGKKNGYNLSDLTAGFSSPAFPSNVSSPGMVTLLPICDYSKPQAPGLNCPNVMADSSSCSF